MAAWDYDEKLDTPKSYKAFCVYLQTDNIIEAYRRYASNPGTAQAPSFFKAWSTKGNWVDRKTAYRADISKKAFAQLKKERIALQKSEMEQFRNAARIISKKQVRTLKALEDLIHIELFVDPSASESKLREDINHKKLQSLISSSQAQYAKNPFDTWAKALQIDAMQQQLDKLQGQENG